MSDRATLPRPLVRALLVEAGHRCAIPTCRQIPVEIHHIVEVAKGGTDDFDNLIVLCRNCHGLQQAGTIDRRSCFAYKRNLSIITGRYGTLERRVLQAFVDDASRSYVELGGAHELELACLLKDGLVSAEPAPGPKEFLALDGALDPVALHPRRYRLTDYGRETVSAMRSGAAIE